MRREQGAQSQWATRILVGGGTCSLSSNSAEILVMLQRGARSGDEPLWQLHVYVEQGNFAPLGEAHFRGLGHVMSACFGDGAIFLFDLLRRRVTAQVSALVAADERYWRQVALPIAAGVMGAATGVVPVHSACLCSGERAILVAGVSGTGKSTLALALAMQGMEFLADDWSYCRITEQGIGVGATEVRLKLLPDAVTHFQELRGMNTAVSLNGEIAFEFDPAEVFPIKRRSQAVAHMLVFYRRENVDGALFEAIPSAEARLYLEDSVERLPVELSAATQRRKEVLEKVAALPCWRFTSSSSPSVAARELMSFLSTRTDAFELEAA